MNKTLGIFGDSFGVYDDRGGWAFLLGNRHSMTTNHPITTGHPFHYRYDIDNYAIGGSSIDLVYYNILKYHNKYEHIVVVLPHPNRITVFKFTDKMHNDRYSYTNSFNEHLENLQVCGIAGTYENWRDYNSEFELNQETEDYILSYKQHWDTHKYSNELLKYHAMVEHIKILRPDAKLINSFPFLNDTALWNITKLDTVKFKSSKEGLYRLNHMSYKQNLELAKNIDTWLNDDTYDFNHTIQKHNVDKYYTSSINIKESGLNA
jgi:hypothetical protein